MVHRRLGENERPYYVAQPMWTTCSRSSNRLYTNTTDIQIAYQNGGP